MCTTTPRTRIAKRLEELGKTQAWLGRKLGVSRQIAGEWVRGDDKVPRARQAQIVLFLGLVRAYPLFDRDGYALREDA